MTIHVSCDVCSGFMYTIAGGAVESTSAYKTRQWWTTGEYRFCSAMCFARFAVGRWLVEGAVSRTMSLSCTMLDHDGCSGQLRWADATGTPQEAPCGCPCHDEEDRSEEEA